MKFFQKKRNVIFKQRTARHLATCSDLKWEYEAGSVVCTNLDGTIAICWLQGYKSRTDDVPMEDIVAVEDKRCKKLKIGSFRGRSRILQEIVQEGT
jgi:hypothetical protein